MFRNISGNKKIIGLMVVTIILLLSSIKKSFKPTFSIYNEQLEVKDKLKFTKRELSSIDNLKFRVENLNHKLGAVDIEPQEVQQQLISYISKIPNVSMVAVDEIHQSTNELVDIYTHQIILEGTFQNLLEAFYDLEKTFNISRIVSTSFQNKKKRGVILKTQRLKIIFQNYEKKK